MKKLVSISLIVALLISCCPSAFAAPTKNIYADMDGSFSSTTLLSSSGASTGFEGSHTPNKDDRTSEFLVSGSETRKKSADDYVWKTLLMAKEGDGNSASHNCTGLVGETVQYQSGDKIYLRSQYYIPDKDDKGVSLLDYEDDLRLRMRVQLGNTTADRVVVVTLKIADSSGGTIAVNDTADNLIKNKWKYNTWHTVEAVITFGTPTRMNVYFDGELLEYKAGGKTENIALAPTSFSATNFQAAIADTAASGSAKFFSASQVRRRLVYIDNLAYESYAAGADVQLWNPPLYNPVSFEGLNDGKKVDTNDFSEVTVSTGDGSFDKVALYVSGQNLGEKSSAPYTFQIPDSVNVPGKSVTLRAVAYDGTDEYEKSITITLTESYSQSMMTELFENYASFLDAQNGGWWNPSSRMYQAKDPGEWYIESASVKDKDNVSFGNCFRFGCGAGANATWLDQSNQEQAKLDFGYQKFNNKSNYVISGDKISLDWYMYFYNENIKSMEMELGSKICHWNPSDGNLTWNVTPAKSSAVTLNKWQHYVLSMDISLATPLASLEVDGVLIFEGLPVTSPFTSFDKVVWSFTPDNVAGSYIALDEIYLNHVVPRPTFGNADYYIGSHAQPDSSEVSADVNAIALTVEGGLLDSNLNDHILFLENGKELKIADANGELKKSTLLLSGTTLWIVPPRPLLKSADYVVRLKSTALFRDYAEIGYDQDFEFKTAYHTIDVKSVEFYKNGSKIDDISSVSFSQGDALKAKVTVVNETDTELFILFMSYNGNKLDELKVSKATPDSGSAEKVYETEEIIIAEATDFSASVSVWDDDLLPISTSVHVQ